MTVWQSQTSSWEKKILHIEFIGWVGEGKEKQAFGMDECVQCLSYQSYPVVVEIIQLRAFDLW